MVFSPARQNTICTLPTWHTGPAHSTQAVTSSAKLSTVTKNCELPDMALTTCNNQTYWTDLRNRLGSKSTHGNSADRNK